MDIQHILVPTDFSENAMKAAEIAAHIASKTNASVTLINGYVRPQGGTSVMMNITELIAKEAQEEMDNMCQTLQQKYPDIVFSGYTKYGYIDEVIQILTQDQPFDIIVMGTTGSDKIQNKVFGSNTSKMIQKSAVPVLSVPSDFNGDDIKTMVLGGELPLKDNAILDRFSGIAKGLGASTEIISMPLKKDKEELQKHINDVKQEKGIAIQLVEGEDFFDTLLQYIEDHQIDGIGLLRKEYGFFENLFHKSKTKELAIYANKPILAIDIN